MLEIDVPKKFLLSLPADLRLQLESIAQREHRKMTNLIVHALREWLEGRGYQTPT